MARLTAASSATFFVLVALAGTNIQSVFGQDYYFIHQCQKSDPEINTCLLNMLNNLVYYQNEGIPEIGLYKPEPIIVDEIGIALGSGPDGYRASFKNIKAFGVSNATFTAARSDIDTLQFQFTIYIPHIKARAKYQSSGILLLVQASGGGDYWGEYDGIKAKVYLRAEPKGQRNGKTYLGLSALKMDFSVKDIKMGVSNVHNGNTVLQAALNLFINSNAQDLLKEMKPQLKKKLLSLMQNFISGIFDRVPLEAFLA